MSSQSQPGQADSQRAHVTHIDGAPGVGKTYSLREKLADEAARGLKIDDFYWLNFSNAGRKDVEPEIRDVFGDTGTDSDEPSPQDRAKTFHGLALSLAIRQGLINGGDDPEQIIVQGQRLNDDNVDDYDPHADFCRRHGLRYDAKAADPQMLLSGESDTDNAGNSLFAINDYLTQTCKPPEKWHHAGIKTKTRDHAVPKLLRAWNDYKKDPPVEGIDRRLFEHGDYVDLAYHAHLIPNASVLLIDEFQDLAPVEYRLYKLWRGANGIVQLYIAGDAQQSLYSFRGGTPVYFNETPADNRIVLKKSYRCPENIAAFANSVLSVHPGTDPHGFAGIDPGGRVTWESKINKEIDLRDHVIDAASGHDASPSVMMLTRTNRQLHVLSRHLRSAGIPFDMLGKAGGVWTDDLADAYSFFSNLKNGGDSFHNSNINAVMESLPKTTERRRSMGKPFENIRSRDSVSPALSDFDSIRETINAMEIKSWRREVLLNAVNSPASIDVGEVQIGTIHTSKGLEAPCVSLFTEVGKSIEERYAHDADTATEEHRTYYVGATRASEELHLVRNYFAGQVAPPIRKAQCETEVIGQ